MRGNVAEVDAGARCEVDAGGRVVFRGRRVWRHRCGRGGGRRGHDTAELDSTNVGERNWNKAQIDVLQFGEKQVKV